MAAITSDLDNILIHGITAMVAAVIVFSSGPAVAHRMLTLSLVCHNLPPFLVKFSLISPEGDVKPISLAGPGY